MGVIERRKQELYRLVEACRHTDNGELDWEKTEAIEELLMEVERLENHRAGGV
jgi:hypothetical protein